MARQIKHPFWANAEKTQIFCTFEYDDGRVLEAVVTKTEEGNPDWDEIMETFGEEGLQKSTDEIGEERRKRQEFEMQQAKEEQERMKTDTLFGAKLEAFEILEIKNSKNRSLKSKIRKANTLLEIQAYTTALIIKEMEAADAKK